MQEAPKTSYELDYGELPFEDVIRQYRQENIIRALEGGATKCILDIGCGPHPLFSSFDNFEKMVVIEPLSFFYSEVEKLAGKDKRIILYNDLFQNVASQLRHHAFDFIIIGGFLHEIKNPDEVLRAIKTVSGPETIIHSFVPNAHSFHRLLAYEMGIIDTVYTKSGHDEMFDRYHVYNIESFKELFEQNGFCVTNCSTYFLKPFTHDQLHDMLVHKSINKSVIDGLNKMVKYFPSNGAEIFIDCKIHE
jgi:SAM-dependent methyltransferase